MTTSHAASTRDVKAAWAKVGDELAGLGLKLKLHVEQEFADDSDDNDRDNDIKNALDRFAEVIEDSFEAAANAASDKAVQEDVVDTGRRLIEAITTTVTAAADEVRAAAVEVRSATERKGDG